MQFIVLGLNHKTAPISVRESVAFTREEIVDALCHLYEYENIVEGLILSTCNRMEVYAVLEDDCSYKETLLDMLSKMTKSTKLQEEYFYFYQGREAMEHLFRVASSLDSLVVGEGQILSQVKQAYVLAHSQGTTGTLLNIIFQRAIMIGKKVRSVTGIAGKPISVSYTAVTLAERVIPNFTEAKALILGAGEMSELVAKHLQSHGVSSIFVSNRTYDRAAELASRLGGKAIHLDHFLEEAKNVDILLTSTGAPHYLLSYKQAVELMQKRNGKSIVMIDIAVPRDIDPQVAMVDGITLFNIDELESVVEENKQHRLEEAEKARPLIEAALDEVEEKLSYLSIRPLMALISEKAEKMRRREVHRMLVKFPDASEREKRLINSMTRKLVGKILRDPMIRFGEVAGKQEEEQYWELLGAMFNVREEEEAKYE